jgi:alkanesulfonate monooxygenase SsuD/methylene tetrahydromethanopterin reductase-like flavin-dependent oxidoreductase (luciferase family)
MRGSSRAPGPGPAEGPFDARAASNTSPRDWGIERLSLGIVIAGPRDTQEWQQALAWIARAEALGLHSVWVPENHFSPGACAAPLLTLSGFAARSRRLRLGTTSLLLPIHPPLRLAAEIAQLDSLSGGRLLLGLGRGFRAPLFQAFGIDPSSRRDRFDDALDQILASWRSDDQREDGKAGPIGAQPRPPMAVAAFGRKGLVQAARRGLPYLASPLEPLPLLAENHRFHAENLPEDANSDALVTPVMRTVHVAGSESESSRVLEALEAEFRAAGRMARRKPPAALARAVAGPLRERVIVGSASKVADTLARYREEIGIDLLIVRPQIAGASDAESEASLERLAGEVLPALD